MSSASETAMQRNASVPAPVYRVWLRNQRYLPELGNPRADFHLYSWHYGCAQCRRYCWIVGQDVHKDYGNNAWRMSVSVVRWTQGVGGAEHVRASHIDEEEIDLMRSTKTGTHVLVDQRASRLVYMQKEVVELIARQFNHGASCPHTDPSILAQQEDVFEERNLRTRLRRSTFDAAVVKNLVGGSLLHRIARLGFSMPEFVKDLTDTVPQWQVKRMKPVFPDSALHYTPWNDGTSTPAEPTLQEGFLLLHAWAAHTRSRWGTLLVACRILARIFQIQTQDPFMSPVLRDIPMELLSALCWVYASYRNTGPNNVRNTIVDNDGGAGRVKHRTLDSYDRLLPEPHLLRVYHIGRLAHALCSDSFAAFLMNELKELVWSQKDTGELVSLRPWVGICGTGFNGHAADNDPAFVGEEQWKRERGAEQQWLQATPNGGAWTPEYDERIALLFAHQYEQRKSIKLLSWVRKGGPLPELTATTDMTTERTQRGETRTWSKINETPSSRTPANNDVVTAENAAKRIKTPTSS